MTDEDAVRDACMRYWAGVDRRDADLYLSAFTADAELELFGGTQVMRAADAAPRAGAGGMDHTCHSLANQVIRVDGDTATADTFAIAHQVPATGPILVRGIRYVDDLARTGGEWRITRRRHDVLWQYDVERVEPHLPA